MVFGSTGGEASYAYALDRPSDWGSSLCLGILAGCIYTYFARNAGLYRLKVLVQPARFMRVIARTCLVSLVTLTAVLFLLKISTDFSRGASLVFAVLVLGLCIVSRMAIGTRIRSMLDRDQIRGRRVIVLGDQGELSRLPARLLLAEYGLQEVGRFPIDAPKSGDDAGWQDAFREVLHLSRVAGASEFLVCATWKTADELARVEQAVRLSPLRVRLLPNAVYRLAMSRSTANDEILSRLIELQRAPMPLLEQVAKRICDIVMSSLALFLLSPLLCAVALAIRFDSKGPTIFRQRRNGFNQKQFVIYKFRSMTVQEDGDSVQQARRNDTRITRIGRFLRRSSIDELPQLFNVLKGDMSLVGPRPHALAHDNIYNDLIDDYCLRHHVKPGITGWAQVNGYRGETARTEQMKRRVELDVWYINNRSLLLDLRIMARTCSELLSHDAY